MNIEEMAKRLEKSGWPEASVSEFRKFGHRSSLLYPYRDSIVRTPKGMGTLHMLLGGKAWVELYDDEDKRYGTVSKPRAGMRPFEIKEVRPA